MMDFDTIPFLSISNQTISLGMALRYLKRAGKLTPFLNEIVGQHILLSELTTRTDLQVSIEDLEAQVHKFRESQSLSTPESFQQWLNQQGLTYGSFHNLVTDELKLEKLKTDVAGEQTSHFFEENHDALAQVKMTYIVLTDKAMADEFRQRIDQGQASFDEIASECLNEAFLKHSDKVTLKQETLRRGQIRSDLQDLINEVAVGQPVGPVEIEQRWWLLKVDAIEEAKLEGPLKQQLETDFFRRWLSEKMQQTPVQLAGKA